MYCYKQVLVSIIISLLGTKFIKHGTFDDKREAINIDFEVYKNL